MPGAKPIRHVRLITQVNDAHAAAVAWALRLFDLDAECICLSEKAADDRGVSFNPRTRFRDLLGLQPDLVWFRRPTRPVHLSGATPDDPDQIHAVANAEETLTIFLEGLEETIAANTVLNRPSAIRRAGNKLVNLYEAARLGLAMPETLITNSIDDA